MFWCNIIHFFKFTYLTYFYSDVGLYFIINWSKMQIVFRQIDGQIEGQRGK